MYKCTTNPHILQYTVVDTLVGREIPEMNLGRLGGWPLEGEARTRRSATGKVAHSQSWAFGSWSRFARACHSLQKQVAPRLKNSLLLKLQKFKLIFFQSRLTNARSNLRSFACRMAPGRQTLCEAASLQNLGSRDPHLTKLALDQALRSCKWTHVSKRMFYAKSD